MSELVQEQPIWYQGHEDTDDPFVIVTVKQADGTWRAVFSTLPDSITDKYMRLNLEMAIAVGEGGWIATALLRELGEIIVCGEADTNLSSGAAAIEAVFTEGLKNEPTA